ncbi:unnamed protein product [Peniophora sp. CBMAI 1063]|nr:unnamed protein product [Peniophora sp. CBMAI 1063]
MVRALIVLEDLFKRRFKGTIQDLPTETLLAIFAHLVIAWPAGQCASAENYTSIGWMVACHVCGTWRRILLHWNSIWSSSVTSFYNVDAVNTFLARSGNAALSIDMNLLHSHSAHMPKRPEVVNAIMNARVLSRSQVILSHARNHRNRGFHPSLPSLMCSVQLDHLRHVDVFIPYHLKFTGLMNARHLQILGLRSNAVDASECPVPLRFLLHIFENCQHLDVIRIHRCVDTTILDDFKPDSTRVRGVLSTIDVGCHDETLLPILSAYFHVQDCPAVTLEVYSTLDLRDTLMLAIDGYGAQRHDIQSLDIKYDEEKAREQDGFTLLYHSVFFGLHLHFANCRTIILRMDVERMTWTWDTFVQLVPCGQIRALTLTNNRGMYRPPASVQPMDMMRTLHNLETIHLDDSQHIHLLHALPLTTPITEIVIRLRSVDRDDCLPQMWQWLRHRTSTTAMTTLILKGNIEMPVDSGNYRYMDGPMLAALEPLVTVCDERDSVTAPY